MNCPKCQTPIPDGSDVCPLCALPRPLSGEVALPLMSRMAKTAHLLAWLGFLGPLLGFGLGSVLSSVGGGVGVAIGLVLGLISGALVTTLGFLLGLVALVRIVASKGRLTGRIHAISAMVLPAVVFCLVWEAALFFNDTRVRIESGRTGSDMRSVMTAIEAYRTDNGTYPVALRPIPGPRRGRSAAPPEDLRRDQRHV